MFTGIIEVKTAVASFDTDTHLGVATLTIEKPKEWELESGQSIAVNGACLSVIQYEEETFSVELIPETLRKTTFGLRIPAKVNLERAMRADGRFEGHIVQGHVDTTGKVNAVTKNDGVHSIMLSYDGRFDPLVIEKGSITIDGVSLTVVDVGEGQCCVHLIPHTIECTTLGLVDEGDVINIEFDIIGKYLNRFRSTPTS